MFYIAIDTDMESGKLAMSDTTHAKMGKPERITLHFGLFVQDMPISIDNSLEEGRILIPARLTDSITIPDLPYETKLEGHSLHIGPVIGFMNKRSLYNNPDLIKTRFCKYSEIKGLILIFAPRHVDKQHKLIRGKYYDPDSDSFKEITAPYPRVIYLRTYPSAGLYRHLRDQLGAGNIFNYPFRSNKRVFWRIASKYPEVKRHLPKTRQYIALGDVLGMLRKYNAVYLKPYNLSRGRGIFRLSREGRGYLLADTYNNTWKARDSNSLKQLLTDKLRSNYLVQQEIPFIYQGQKIDYRIFLQKNKHMQWEYRGFDAKFANEGSIISNSRNRQQTLHEEEGLELVLGLDKQAARDKIVEIMKICIKALKAMEDNGHSLGDVAIDLILDKNQKIWLLEVQPDHYCDVLIDKHEYYIDVLHRDSFDYAKALAGFK